LLALGSQKFCNGKLFEDDKFLKHCHHHHHLRNYYYDFYCHCSCHLNALSKINLENDFFKATFGKMPFFNYLYAVIWQKTEFLLGMHFLRKFPPLQNQRNEIDPNFPLSNNFKEF